MKRRIVCVVVGCLSFALSLAAQTASGGSASAQVPPLILFSNVATDEGGNTLSGVVNITFSLYAGQRGGKPLWTETQNVQLDSSGHYSVQLGITKTNGVPATLFTTGEARWLGVEIAQQPEQARVLLLSVPYALKAGDAATLGGLPASAFVLAAPQNGVAPAYTAEAANGQSVSPVTATDVTTSGGTVNYLPLWDTTSDIVSSVLFQSGTGATARIGINTATPVSTLDIKGGSTVRGILSLPVTGNATATAGKNSQLLSFAASAFNSSSSAAASQTFRLQAEPANNDSASPSGTLNLLFGEGTTTPTETGLHIASNGQITFAAGQTFPGAGTGDGTVTSVASGAGLSGGPITSSGTLSITTGGVTNAMLANPSLTVTAGTGLTGGGSVALGGSTTALALAPNACASGNALSALPFTCSPFAQLGANTFTGTQTITGNLALPNTNVGGTQGVILFGGLPFIHDYGPAVSYNSFFGYRAGNLTNTGSFLTAVGDLALASDTSGSYNTASGYQALVGNTTGPYNVASGYQALGSNTIGGYNVANGYQALYANATTSGNVAVGYAAAQKNIANYNTAVGDSALINNTTGTNNTALGISAGPSTGGLSNTTAVGSNATVSESNALVLGCVANLNSCPSTPISVGIGTASPGATLDVRGTGNFTGLITFASGQTFPGVPSLGIANTFTAAQTINAGAAGDGLSVIGSGGDAIYAINNASSGNTFGLSGWSSSSTGVGVTGVAYGQSNTASNYIGGGSYGVWGDTGSNQDGELGMGVLGTADDAYAGLLANDSNYYETLVLVNDGSGGTLYQNNAASATVLSAYGGSTGKGCTMDVSGTLNCEGTVTAIVPTASGARKVSLYAVQSPENWFEDFGSGALSNGAATITLDPTFTQTVNTGSEYHVFLTPNGDSKGLYVSQKTATSFEVREQGGGHSSIAFDYRIVAKRSGYENVRLTDVTEQYKRMEEQRELRRGRQPVRPAALPHAMPALGIPGLRAVARPVPDQSK